MTQTDDAQARHPAAPLRPATRRERIVAIDAMRGVALLGILLINVQYFQGPQPWLEGPAAAWRGLDRILFLLASWLVEGKFVSMFAFLFGVGMALQLRRAADGGAAPARLLVRRLLVLGGFGLLHATLIWYGDILLTYAITGLILLLFRNRSVRALRAWGAGLLGTACGVLVLVAVLALATNGLDTTAAPAGAGANALAESGLTAYTSGDYGQMLRQRLQELAVAASSFPLNLPWVLGLMLFGLVENYELRRTSLLNSMRQTANTSGLLVDASLQEARGLAQAIAAESVSHGSELNRLQAFLARKWDSFRKSFRPLCLGS